MIPLCSPHPHTSPELCQGHEELFHWPQVVECITLHISFQEAKTLFWVGEGEATFLYSGKRSGRFKRSAWVWGWCVGSHVIVVSLALVDDVAVVP